jgi:hypothetical protein
MLVGGIEEDRAGGVGTVCESATGWERWTWPFDSVVGVVIGYTRMLSSHFVL